MKVAIDSGPLEGGHAIRGVGVYTRELIKELKKLETKEIVIDAVDFEKADLARYDIVHYPYFNPFFVTLPVNKPAKVIVTIHDLIPLIYPTHYAPGLKGRLKFQLQRLLTRRVDAIIAVSETSRKDIVRFLGIDQEKITAIYEAPKEIFGKLASGDPRLAEVKKKYNLPRKFALYVGDVNYNKNVISLVRACQKINLPLVIAGKHAGEVDEIDYGLDKLAGPRDWYRFLFNIPHPEIAHYRKLKSAFAKANVIRPGFVADADLVALYNLASVYVQPSLYEGFGLPVLEAMASETPVVIAKNNALVEIAGGAAVVADATSEDLAEKIAEVIKGTSDTVKHLRAGKTRAAQFSWEKCASQTLEVYGEVLKGGK